MATRKRTSKSPSLYDRFIALDDALAARGVPPLGGWWRAGLKRWFDAYERGEVLELWACTGRGAAKSTATYKLAIFFTLFGDFIVPPGERHYAVILSRLKEEAKKGITIISQWLRLLGKAHRIAGDVIELNDTPRGIRVVAASVGAASGWRAYFIGCDEFSKWGSETVDELDSEEIRTSAVAMGTTHARAPLVVAGSAWGAFGSFYDVIMAGDALARVVLGPAPTWVASDGRITEAMCRAKEPDDRKFQREYECVFQGSATAAFDINELRACIDPDDDFAPGPYAPFVVQDPSGGSTNAHAWAAFRWGFRRSAPVSAPILRMSHAHAIDNAKARGFSSDDIADRVAATARETGAAIVYSDQHAAWTWASAYQKRNLLFREFPWTNPTKGDAVVRLRELISSRSLSIEAGDEADALIREAGLFEERLTPSGNITFNASRGNDDRVSLLLLVARLDSELRLKGSPVRRSGGLVVDLHATPIPPQVRERSEHIERRAAHGMSPAQVAKFDFDGVETALIHLRTRGRSAY